MQSPEVVAGIIGSLLCHYPVPILLAIPAILGILAIARHTCHYPVPTPLVITGTAELLHPGHHTGYAGSAGPGKTLLPSLVIDASVGAKHKQKLRGFEPQLSEEIKEMLALSLYLHWFQIDNFT